MSRMSAYRLVIGAAGVALGMFGVYRLLTQVVTMQLISIGEWIVGAVVLHDLLLSPAVVGLGVGLSFVPPRARRYLQGGLIAGGLLTSLGVVFVIYTRTTLLDHQLAGGGSLPRAAPAVRRAKSILTQDYLAHLLVLLAVVAGAALLLYVRRVVLDARGTPRDGRPHRPLPHPTDEPAA